METGLSERMSNVIVGFEVLTAVDMSVAIFWDIVVPSHLLHDCFLLG
jgi:hypothetical protein